MNFIEFAFHKIGKAYLYLAMTRCNVPIACRNYRLRFIDCVKICAPSFCHLCSLLIPLSCIKFAIDRSSQASLVRDRIYSRVIIAYALSSCRFRLCCRLRRYLRDWYNQRWTIREFSAEWNHTFHCVRMTRLQNLQVQTRSEILRVMEVYRRRSRDGINVGIPEVPFWEFYPESVHLCDDASSLSSLV
jgi:hypothetical protein